MRNKQFIWKEELFRLPLNLADKNHISDYITEKQLKIKSMSALKKAITNYKKNREK